MAVTLNTTQPSVSDVMSATKKRISQAMQQSIQTATAEQQPAPAIKPPTQTPPKVPLTPQENNKIIGAQPTAGVDASYKQPNATDFGGQLTPELASKIMQDGGLTALYSAINKESAREGQEAIDLREKKERQRALISSISDGMSSIANLAGTLGGGINQKQTSLSEANAKRRDYQQQLRNRDTEKWRAMMSRAGEMQQNYNLSRDKLKADREDAYLKNEYQKQTYELQMLREARMYSKSEAEAKKIDYQIRLLEAQANKTASDMENNSTRANAYAKTAESSARARETNANANQTRALSAKEKNEEEVRMRELGLWNQSQGASGSNQSSSMFTPTAQPATVAPTPAKKAKTTPAQPTEEKKNKYDFNPNQKS